MSFRIKTILGVGLIEAALLLLMVWNSLNFLSSSTEKEFLARADTTTDLFAKAIKDAVIATDLAALESFLEEVLSHHEIVYARVLGPDGMPYAQGAQRGEAPQQIKPDVSLAHVDDAVFDTFADISEAGYRFGRVELGFSIGNLISLQTQARRTLTSLALLEMVAVGLFSFLLGVYLTRQLTKLNDASQRIADGELGFTLPVRGKDELAQTARAFNRMSRRLQAGENRKAAIFRSSIDGILVLSAEGCILEANEAVARLLGVARLDIIGKRFVDVALRPCDREAMSKEFIEFVNTGEMLRRRREEILVHADGTHFTAELALTDVYKNEESNFAIFIRDVSERKLAEQKMIEAVSLAEQSSEAKSEFIANISHELRTPIQGINGFSELGLKRFEKASPEKLKKYFQVINDSGKTLLLLVNELLDLAKLESGKMEMNYETQRLEPIISRVASEFQSRLDERQLSLKLPELSESKAVEIPVDAHRISQLIRNLLGNAVKFTGDGTCIEIYIAYRPRYVQVSVADAGVGIPDNELESIFEKFVQSSETKTGAGGTGLGLAICQQIVAGHHGRLWAENNRNGGATFSFQLVTRLPETEALSQAA